MKKLLTLTLLAAFAVAAHAAIDPALLQQLGAEESDDKIAAIDALVDKLDRQVLKHKEKLADRRRDASGKHEAVE